MVSSSLYLFIVITLIYFFSGHIFILFLIRSLRPRETKFSPDLLDKGKLPKLNIIVPFFNEQDFLEGKIKNLLSLRWASQLGKIILVDGGSTDKSLEIVSRYLMNEGNWEIKLYKSPLKGKINQLNHALNLIPKNELVLVTDADAIFLDPNCLYKAYTYFVQNENVGLVGGWTMPSVQDGCMQEELAFWDKQNRLRYMEMQCFSSSIVVAPFYMFKREIISSFPSDCIADDVYLSLLTHMKSSRIIYSPEVEVVERRTPRSTLELIKHKLRKSNAYMTELFRFLYKIPYMGNRLKYIYFHKLFQFFYMPWAVLAYLFLTTKMILDNRYDIVIITSLSLFTTALLASLTMISPPGHKRGGLKFIAMMSTLKIFALTSMILVVDLFIYPFWRQNAIYKKVNTIE